MRPRDLLASLLLLAACGHDEMEMLEPVEICNTMGVTWSGTIVPILQTHCALSTCHVPGGNGTGNFTTYAGVQTQVANGKLVNAVQHLPGALPMPPDGVVVPPCDIAALVAWVNAGAPEN